MASHRLLALTAATLTAVLSRAAAAPTVSAAAGRIVVTASDYRLSLGEATCDLALELRGSAGVWVPVTAGPAGISFGVLTADEAATSNGLAVQWVRGVAGDAVSLAGRLVLDPVGGTLLDVHLLCADAGILVGGQLGGPAKPAVGSLWCPPRLTLAPGPWERYAFWSAAGQFRAGRIADLGPLPAYAGVSPWERQGDTAPALEAGRPALLLQSATGGPGLGIVFVDYAGAWQGSSSFLQRHTAAALYFYAGYTPLAAASAGPRWAWLAPFAGGDAAATSAWVRDLLAQAGGLLAAYHPEPLSPAPGAALIPDFPAALQRTEPVADLRDAVVYTINEGTRSAYGLDLARKVGSEMMIRAWFKWRQAPRLDHLTELPSQAQAFGARFGGGITCSALYDDENGLTAAQVADMATRGPDGGLVDAWDQPGTRHGSLSSPAYLDYLLRWCNAQIAAGVDALFMDEHNAALSDREGYDDHSLRDFRQFLLGTYALTRDWGADEPRWQSQYGIDPTDRALCPDGTLQTFDYRAYLRARNLFAAPQGATNPLAGAWGDFRRWRDDRAWKALTDRIRAAAAGQGRQVLISANGIAPYVDLQVLGVWGKWQVSDGHIELTEDLMSYWRSLVVSGRQAVGGQALPVVLFHDWGFGEPPFPWLAVPAAEREVWMRTRAAEIYAAGAFFAFPVLGPFGCDAGRDGTLGGIARQTAFYRTHRELYLHSRWLGCERLTAEAPLLSLAAWWNAERQALVVHVVNRDVRAGVLQARPGPLRLRLPVPATPLGATAVSPDYPDERPVGAALVQGGTELTLAGLEAYSVVLVRYAQQPDVSGLADPARLWLSKRWTRPARADFRVLPGGLVPGAGDLEGFLQGRLHAHLRNPPVFQLHAVRAGELRMLVRCVATAGATLAVQIDDEPWTTVDLPDLDGSNRDSGEYRRVLSFPIPAGRHRLRLENRGGDWAVVDWLEFVGEFAE